MSSSVGALGGQAMSSPYTSPEDQGYSAQAAPGFRAKAFVGGNHQVVGEPMTNPYTTCLRRVTTLPNRVVCALAKRDLRGVIAKWSFQSFLLNIQSPYGGLVFRSWRGQ